MGSGAVETRLRIWLSAWVRPLRADALATRNTRMDSTFPSLLLASPAASPERAARAAVMASWGSDLPFAPAALSVGTVDFDDADPFGLEMTGEPGSIGPSPFDADQLDEAEVAQPPQQLLVAALGGGEALDAEEGYCHPFVGLGWVTPHRAGRRTRQRRACVRQAPIRSLRPTGGCRVGDRARPTDRTKDSPKGTSAGCLESDLVWAPTHTLTSSLTEVVDHSAATSILAAGWGALCGHPFRGSASLHHRHLAQR